MLAATSHVPSANEGLRNLSAEVIGCPRLQEDLATAASKEITKLSAMWLLLLASIQNPSHVGVELLQMKIH